MFPSRRSIRVPEYDYSQPGKYFVTLVSYQRKPSFGCINHEGQVEINPLGKIVHYEWLCLKEILPVELDEFVIMPNHFHAILVLPGGNDLLPSIPHKGLVSGSLGMLIGQFKSRVTRHIRVMLNAPDFLVWQRNYYEHIIRRETDLSAIRHYIQENPSQWSHDQLYLSNA
jgi:putative transposase